MEIGNNLTVSKKTQKDNNENKIKGCNNSGVYKREISLRSRIVKSKKIYTKKQKHQKGIK